MLKKPYLRSKICNINFWIGNDSPPPFGTFPKIHPFWRRPPSLSDDNEENYDNGENDENDDNDDGEDDFERKRPFWGRH